MRLVMRAFPGMTQLDLTGPLEVFARLPGLEVEVVARHDRSIPLPGGLSLLAVCSGSPLLAAAGLLTGYRTTFHWLSLDQLRPFGAIPVAERMVVDRDRITGAGVTSGVDFALLLAGMLFGEQQARAVQPAIEYAPRPPFGSGGRAWAGPLLVERVERNAAGFQARRAEVSARAAAKLARGRVCGPAGGGGKAPLRVCRVTTARGFRTGEGIGQMNIDRSRVIAVLDAPSNLGLSPPAEGSVPGVYKLPWALRESGLVSALSALDAGTVIPPRYVASWQAGSGTRNAAALATYSRKLAARIEDLLRSSHFPLVLGGDCSILIAAALALREEGPVGLAFIDAHSDFRHPGNAGAIRAAAGEDLAICTGRGDPLLTALGAGTPLVHEGDVVLVGTREQDEHLDEVRGLGMAVVTAGDLRRLGAGEAAARIASLLERGAGADRFWIHLDLDVVDCEEMWAVDSPEPDGPGLDLILDLVGILAADRRCRGMHVTIYDPDLDPELGIARRLVQGLAVLAGSFAAPS